MPFEALYYLHPASEKIAKKVLEQAKEKVLYGEEEPHKKLLSALTWKIESVYRDVLKENEELVQELWEEFEKEHRRFRVSREEFEHMLRIAVAKHLIGLPFESPQESGNELLLNRVPSVLAGLLLLFPLAYRMPGGRGAHIGFSSRGVLYDHSDASYRRYIEELAEGLGNMKTPKHLLRRAYSTIVGLKENMEEHRELGLHSIDLHTLYETLHRLADEIRDLDVVTREADVIDRELVSYYREALSRLADLADYLEDETEQRLEPHMDQLVGDSKRLKEMFKRVIAGMRRHLLERWKTIPDAGEVY